jgi:ABC-type branched-subunit amino acid transport system permease subunit
MKFEIKTEPVCAALVAVPAYVAIVVVVIAKGRQAQDTWFPLSVIVVILAIGMNFVLGSTGLRREIMHHVRL